MGTTLCKTLLSGKPRTLPHCAACLIVVNMQALSTVFYPSYQERLRSAGADLEEIGQSEAGRALWAYRIGERNKPLVSIVAGSHPDEPAGPLAAVALAERYAQSCILQQVQLAVVPQMDPDGVYLQQEWLEAYQDQLDPLLFLQNRVRREPGADREFAWPGAAWGGCVLPENIAADAFLNTCGPAITHLSLHGMAVAEGAWFLLNDLALRNGKLWTALRQIAGDAGLGLHDSFRYGDKGFRRCAHGFCTTPTGFGMRQWALRDAPHYRDGFGLSSMDAACLRAAHHKQAKPLCAVSEFPLIEIRQPGDGSWREIINSIPLSENPENAWSELQTTFDIHLVPLHKQVDAMVQICEAVIQAAL